jgi:metal-responsive CopG/Arc/MetJ family transcriptional regulator
MKAIQMTLDDELVQQVDTTVKRLHTTRSAFARDALREAVQRAAAMRLEERHREGYLARPVTKNEFSLWEKEQAWGDE